MQSTIFRDFNDESEKPLKLKNSDVKIWASFSDPNFDNDDNQYATIKMHYFSNEITKNLTYPEEEVPMVACQNEYLEPLVQAWYPGIIYCPDWKDNHTLSKNYLYETHSWSRLAVHRCDSEKRALVNKTCASDEEINKWLSQTIYTT